MKKAVPIALGVLMTVAGVVWALQGLGYTDVAHLDGGLKVWKEQGRPVTSQSA